MFIRLLFCSALVFSFSCTKKGGQVAENKYLSFDSPVRYIYENLSDQTQAALVEETPVSWSQLMSQDLAMQELQSTYENSKLAFAYAWAKEKAGDGSVELVFLGEKPEALKPILDKYTVEASEQVNVEFVNEKKPPYRSITKTTLWLVYEAHRLWDEHTQV